uniref:Uncharacterized protein n=1 Tax=Arundo donax TaxID=35708 RepID=A0A0A8YW79_ARUDO
MRSTYPALTGNLQSQHLRRSAPSRSNQHTPATPRRSDTEARSETPNLRLATKKP